MNDKSTIPSAALDSAIAEQARDLCQQGYAFYDQGDFKTALRRFYMAWTLLPKPQTQWQEAGWVLTALGDAYFAKGEYENGREALMSALHCPKTQGNPFIHLRLGQCLFELGELEEARRELKRTVEHKGEGLFDKEDPKYYAVLTSGN